MANGLVRSTVNEKVERLGDGFHGGLTSLGGRRAKTICDDLVQTPFLDDSEGTAVLFFIQIFSTLGFAVLYSTLVLYATKHLQLSEKMTTIIDGRVWRV